MRTHDRVIGVADTLGAGGVFIDPVWRVQVDLTPLERDLLRSWWVRRLGFVVHAGAAAISSTQSYSRLEHSWACWLSWLISSLMISSLEQLPWCTTSDTFPSVIRSRAWQHSTITGSEPNGSRN